MIPSTDWLFCRLRSEEIESRNSARHDNLQATISEAVGILRSSGPQQEIIANDVQEIKQLLLRPHSPIPDYAPPLYSDSTSLQSPLEPPQILLPMQSTPLASKNVKVRSSLLHLGAQKGDMREVREALSISQIDINARDEDGRTALHVCGVEGKTRVARYLCENSASVNVEDLSGATPLHLAAVKGNLEMVALLISHGAVDASKDDDGLFARDYAERRSDHVIAWMIASGTGDIEKRNPSTQRTALIHCTVEHHYEAVKSLLRMGANVETSDRHDSTALMYASREGDSEMVRILTSQAKTALNSRNKNGSTALMWAAMRGNIEVLKLLLKHNPELELSEHSGAQSPIARTALFLALDHGFFEAADLLLEAGASVEGCDKDGHTALHHMAARGKVRAIEWLVYAGVSIDAQTTSQSWTALHKAADQGKLNAVEMLLSHGACTELRGKEWGTTALDLAANNAHLAVVRALAEAGANINHIDINGRTPLDEACRRNHLEVARLLVEQGAFLDTRDRWGYTPLHRACQAGHYPIAKVLLEKGANPSVIETEHKWTPLQEAVNVNDADLVDLLIRYGAKLETKTGGNGYTALCMAASHCKLPCVKLLVRAGANLTALGGFGAKWTALDEAAHYGQFEMAKFLLEAGSHPDGGFGHERGDWGWTPLMRASMKGHLSICKLLLEKKADMHVRSLQGRTAVSIATEYGKEEVLMYLTQQV